MRLVLQAALAAAFSILPWANSAFAAPQAKALFASDDTLHLTIKGPINGISRDPAAKPVPGSLTVAGSAPETLPIELSTRGITRRRRDICSFPPLRVEFTAKPGEASLFKGQKRLKLVTHCKEGDNFLNYVLLEYASYRLYNALTPLSFRVRLAQIDYVSDSGRPITSRIGFFIEDENDVAKRNGLERVRGLNKILFSQLDPAASARFAVFQYMISNLDWAMTASPAGEDCCHNSRLLSAAGATTGYIPVPYDFDYGGLVNAPYASPPESIPLANVRIRRYRGFCQHNDLAQAVAADMLARRASLMAIVDQTPQLDSSARSRADSFLDDFFDQIATPQQAADKLLKTCLAH